MMVPIFVSSYILPPSFTDVSSLDALDRSIISFLRLNGRMSHEQISRQVNLSRPAVHERIKRLEEQGIIRGYQALVDWSALGLPLTAFIWVRTSGPHVTKPDKRFWG
jgi:DNA-binding Lrp family transcriptional regulator